MRPRNIFVTLVPRFSLRSLLLVGIALGTWIGIAGPKITQAIRQWTTPPPAPSIQLIIRDQDWDENDTGYYESAETPLR